MTVKHCTYDPRVDEYAFAALGFATNSAGIAQRQREHRDGWQAHAARSKSFILDAAMRVARPRLVVLLGAGKAYDLPLADLARRFERVILIDIDAQALAETADAAVRDAKLRQRLELRAMDLGGVGAKLVRSIEKIMALATDAASAEAAFATLCREYRMLEPPRWLAPGETADLLVSALVLTQLALPVKLFARDHLEKRFGPLSPAAQPRFEAEWDALDLCIQQDHIDALPRQAELAVLTTEVAHRVTALDGRGTEQPTGESWSLIGGKPLRERVPAGVEIAAATTWRWPRIRPQAGGLGAVMDVEGLLLRRR